MAKKKFIMDDPCRFGCTCEPKQWTMWMREKGTFGIAHLLKETRKSTDYTICGMEYDSKTEKKTDGAALIIRCSDCANGKHNEGELRSSLPFN